MKPISVLFVVLAGALIAFAGCDSLSGPSSSSAETIPGPEAPGVAIGSEAMLVSWPAVAGATEYSLLYTDDGSSVGGGAGVVYTGSGTTFIHSDLDSSRSYRYALRVRTAEGLSGIGESSDSAQPNPVIRLNATFAGMGNTKVGAGFLRTETNDTGTVLQYVWRGATTDGTGFAQIQFDAVRGNWYGITLFVDVAENGILNEGDTVWGPGDGVFTYFTYGNTTPIGNSVSIMVPDWATYQDVGTNTF